MSKLDFSKMYKIIENCDASYDGKFFYAVKTTGIYCRPSCKSKTPKIENVEFFNSAEECVKKGYRACKRCRSDLYDYNHTMEKAKEIKLAIDNLYDDNDLLELTLKNINLSNKRAVEIFQKYYNKTPSCYITEVRINKAKEELKNTDKQIINIAFEVGFNSVSTFYRIFKQHEKTSPTNYKKKMQIFIKGY